MEFHNLMELIYRDSTKGVNIALSIYAAVFFCTVQLIRKKNSTFSQFSPCLFDVM